MSFWSRFWCLLGPSWPPIWDPFGAKIGSKSLLDASCLPKRQFSKNSGETNRISLFLPPQWLPKTSQNRPKRLPREPFFRLRFRLRFRDDFGTILAPKMPPFWHPFGDQNRAKKWSKIGSLQMSPQDRPKTAQDLPKTPPRAPQEPPRPPKRSKRAEISWKSDRNIKTLWFRDDRWSKKSTFENTLKMTEKYFSSQGPHGVRIFIR